jgi:hypothetical protein
MMQALNMSSKPKSYRIVAQNGSNKINVGSG